MKGHKKVRATKKKKKKKKPREKECNPPTRGKEDQKDETEGEARASAKRRGWIDTSREKGEKVIIID